MSDLGERLRSMRKARRMTLEQVAEGLCTVGYLSRIENGQREPTSQLVEKLAERLQTTPAALHGLEPAGAAWMDETTVPASRFDEIIAKIDREFPADAPERYEALAFAFITLARAQWRMADQIRLSRAEAEKRRRKKEESDGVPPEA